MEKPVCALLVWLLFLVSSFISYGLEAGPRMEAERARMEAERAYVRASGGRLIGAGVATAGIVLASLNILVPITIWAVYMLMLSSPV